MGAMKMCRCFEYETKTMKPEMMATLRMRNVVARSALVPAPRGASQAEMPREAKALQPL